MNDQPLMNVHQATDEERQYPVVRLMPGGMYLGSRGEKVRVWTILGSCVSVLIHSPELNMGWMNHAQLPEENSNGTCKASCPNPCGRNSSGDRFRYATCSVRGMLDSIRANGVKMGNLKVVVIGGASMFSGKSAYHVNERNVQTTLDILTQANLKPVTQIIGGNSGRTVWFYPESGHYDLG